MMKNNRDIMVSYNRNCAELECFLEFKKLCKNASIVSKSLIYLPTHPEYEVNQIKMNIKHINEYFKKR